MTVYYDYTASVNLKCQTDTDTGQTSIVEASVLLDAQGMLFTDWFRSDGRPSLNGHSAALEAFTFGAAITLRELQDILGKEKVDLLVEQTISRLRLLIEAPVEEKGHHLTAALRQRKPKKK